MLRLNAYTHHEPVPTSAVVWRGPSNFNNAPIVAIVTGLVRRSTNAKTGANLAQLWILAEDVSPMDAIKVGRDQSICGTCRHRGDGTGKDRSCYVVVKNAPLSVWKTYASGGYASMRPADVATHLASRGMGIRLGAYGDAAALPIDVIRDITNGIFHTGYTHAWRSRPDLAPWLMASTDSANEQALASDAGWRTFRVRTPDQSLVTHEIACPASAEAGARTNCDRCVLCDGARGAGDRRANVAILAHGTGAHSFLRVAAV